MKAIIQRNFKYKLYMSIFNFNIYSLYELYKKELNLFLCKVLDMGKPRLRSHIFVQVTQWTLNYE